MIQRIKTLSKNLGKQAENDIAAFNFSNITEVINKAVSEDSDLAFAILMDSSQVAYIHTRDPQLQQETLLDSEAIFAVKQLELATNEYADDNSEYLEYIVPLRISTNSWGVLRLVFSLDTINQEIVVSRSEIIVQIKLMIIRSIITSAVFIIFGSVIIWIVSTQLTKPISSLTAYSYELAKGNFDAAESIQVTSEDEVGALADAFVKMSENLKNSYEKLEEYNKTLEQKVDERTGELKGVNKKLQGHNKVIQLLQKIATAANECSTFEEAAQIAINEICAYTRWPVGHLYLPKKDSYGTVFPTKIWHLADAEQFEIFREVTERTPFELGIGLPGRVMERKKSAWIIDVTKDPNFPRAKLAADIGVKAGFGFPVMAGKDVGAVLEFFSADAVEPDPGLLEIMVNMGTNLGRIIERDRAEGKIISANSELTKALENLQTAQSQLVESEKMASLGGLVAGIAHEINTPIGIGVTAASLLEDKTLHFDTTFKGGGMKRSDLIHYIETCRQSSQMILSNLHRAAELIQSFKKVAVDQSSEGRRVFKIKEYLEEIILSLRPKLKKTKHVISIICDETIQLDSYPGAFSQIITNLILNSVDHAYNQGDEGHPTIEVNSDGKNLSLTYTDDGGGIEPKILDQVFYPFFTTKRGQGGSGLGLHLVYNLVTQKLKGTIKCESKVGKGTIFHISVPQTIEEEEIVDESKS